MFSIQYDYSCSRTMLRVMWMFTLIVAASAENLLKNADFEEPFSGQNNWWCVGGCTLVQSTDAYKGQFSGMVTARTAPWMGVTQNVDVQAGGKYYFNMMIKLLNQVPSRLWHQVNIQLAITYVDGSTSYPVVGRLPYLRIDQEWQKIGGDFHIPDRIDIDAVRVYLQMVDTEIIYLVDDASLIQIYDNPSWREEADLRIENNRKNNIDFNVQISENFDPSDIIVQVSQTRSHFPFGCTVNARHMANTGDVGVKYRGIFFNFFEWSVIENNLKWKDMERIRYIIDFETADRAIDVLESNNIPVRGHTLVWGIEQWIQDWLFPMDGQEIREEVARRIDYTVDYYKDRLLHWDVNNEQLHGSFYEEKTGDPDYLDELFLRAQGVAPNTKFFLNDYQVVNQGHYTQAFANQATSMLSRGVPVYGIGVQSHLDHFSAYPDITLIEERVKRLSETGLPIWVTELDYADPDVTTRAQVYEDVLRLYYSMEEVEGVLLWGFWNHAHWKPDASLVDGDDFIVNEAGNKVYQLLQNEWKTRATFYPTSASNEFQIRGFQGSYNVSVLHNEQIIQTQEFELNPGQDISVDVEI